MPACRTTPRSVAVATIVALACCGLSLLAEQRSAWEAVPVPDHWKQSQEADAGQIRYSWYRCLVEVPEDWRGKELELFLEPIDDARQIFFNGQKIGQVGMFPPQYRSGLGGPTRHAVPPKHVRYGAANVLAIRVCQYDGRGGFNVAAPVLFGPEEGIRLEGEWEFCTVDDIASTAAAKPPGPPARYLFSKVESAEEIAASLWRLEGDPGPQSPVQALARFAVAEDLELELVLAEPYVAQPLSMKFDRRGRLWVVQYLQYPTPAGLKMVSRDKHLRTVYDRVPPPPPHHFRGQDKITIHEDTDGDGALDTHTTFVEGLNIVSSFALGQEGVWVLNPPYLLFYPDRDQDDVPDSDPEVHLEGFGLEDSHSIVNSLRFGPDGWLYAAQGSTVTGNVRRPGSDEPPVQSMGQLIWRYHPVTRRYEIFAEGGGNAFGIEIDSKGRIYSGHNGGNTRGFHYVQGGYYLKGFGKHGSLSNPFTFGYFQPMQHPSVPRFTHTFILYEADALPESYQGDLFAVAPLQSHIVRSEIQPVGSTFKTVDVGHPLASGDPWFRPVDIQLGPDGAIYIADFYEQRIDHASHYQGRVDRGRGRIYRLKTEGISPERPVNLEQLSELQLIELLKHPNRTLRQTALQLIGQRQEGELSDPLRKMLQEHGGQAALEALWALNLSGSLSDHDAQTALAHEDPYVRLWMIRLLCDDHEVSDQFARQLQQIAQREPHAEVRSQLAASARRLPAAQCLPIVRALLEHSGDLDDPHLPLMLWWAIEAHAEADRAAVLALFEDLALWELPLVEQHILSRLMRRYAQSGKRGDLLACARLLQIAPSAQHAQQLMKGFEEAFEGRALPPLPEDLIKAMSKAGGGSLVLRLRQDDPTAVQQAIATIKDQGAPSSQRIQYIEVMGQLKHAAALEPLLELLQRSQEDALRSAALTALQSYDDPRVAKTILRLHNQLPPNVQEVAQLVLASRRFWSIAFLDAVQQNQIPAEEVSRDLVRKIMLHDDSQIRANVERIWGNVQGATTEQMRQRIDELARLIQVGSGNPYSGEILFQQTCGKCHVLFDEGGQIGPDLTGYKRDDLQGMLLHVVNPSAEIREGFENYLILTPDGRALNGFVVEQDNQVVVLRGVDGQSRVLAREEIEQMQAVEQSLMPEGLLEDLSQQQVRDLFAYLRASQPLP